MGSFLLIVLAVAIFGWVFAGIIRSNEIQEEDQRKIWEDIRKKLT